MKQMNVKDLVCVLLCGRTVACFVVSMFGIKCLHHLTRHSAVNG